MQRYKQPLHKRVKPYHIPRSRLTTSTLPSAQPPRAPLSPRKVAIPQIRQKIKPDYLLGERSQYGGDHVQRIDNVLRDSGADDPWSARQGTWAHPGLAFFMPISLTKNKYVYQHDNTDHSSEAGENVSKTIKKPKLVAIRGLNGYDSAVNGLDANITQILRTCDQSQTTSDTLTTAESLPEIIPGYGNHAVLGGKLTFNTPISVHNQRVMVMHLPTPPPEYKKRRDLTSNGSTNLQYKDFILQKQLTAISSHNYSLGHVMREEYHGFFPSTSHPEIPPTDAIAIYNKRVAEWNASLEEKMRTGEVDSKVAHSPLPEMIIKDIIRDVAIAEQFSLPDDQLDEIRAELSQTYKQLYDEMLSSSSPHKPFLDSMPVLKQQGYLFSAIANILKRKFKQNLTSDWQWAGQKIDLKLVDLFNSYTQTDATHVLTQPDAAETQGLPTQHTIVSPHFLALYCLDYLGVVSQDTTPTKSPIFETLEKHCIDTRKRDFRHDYANFKDDKRVLSLSQFKLQSQLRHREPGTPPDPQKEHALKEIQNQFNNTLENDEYKSLLKQRLEIQPWHTLYQQLTSFEYLQHRPVVVTQTPTPDGKPQQHFTVDIFAKVLTEHESHRRQTYHLNLENKMGQFATKMEEINELKKIQQKQIQSASMGGENSALKHISPTTPIPSSLLQMSQSDETLPVPLTSQISKKLKEMEASAYITLPDLVRNGELRVKIWIETKPIITTTITSSEQRPKITLPNVDDMNDSDDDLDSMFNEAKRDQWEAKMRIKQEQRETSSTLSHIPSKTIDEEYQLPSATFEVTNQFVPDLCPDEDTEQDVGKVILKKKNAQHAYPVKSKHEEIEQEHHVLHRDIEQYRQGTIVFEGVVTFNKPNLSLCGLPLPKIEEILHDIQKL